MGHPFLYSHFHLIAALLMRFVLLQLMNKRPEMKALNIVPAGADRLNSRTAVLSVNHAGNFAVLNVQTSSVGYPADLFPYALSQVEHFASHFAVHGSLKEYSPLLRVIALAHSRNDRTGEAALASLMLR